ncbi:MAG: winged helix-turn-helix domain-containing protein [Candidatus Bathyarchaeota archaeon]|nr:winged helix-turn-helix domain-containing protein [Candidatus Bathyarchaeota archaeon]
MTVNLTDRVPKRRDKLVIMTEILDIARNGSSKTHIMFKANLSFSQLNDYLAVLSRTNLLEKLSLDGHEIYRPTEKGLEFMQMQQAIISLLNEDLRHANVKTSMFDFISL